MSSKNPIAIDLSDDEQPTVSTMEKTKTGKRPIETDSKPQSSKKGRGAQVGPMDMFVLSRSAPGLAKGKSNTVAVSTKKPPPATQKKLPPTAKLPSNVVTAKKAPKSEAKPTAKKKRTKSAASLAKEAEVTQIKSSFTLEKYKAARAIEEYIPHIKKEYQHVPPYELEPHMFQLPKIHSFWRSCPEGNIKVPPGQEAKCLEDIQKIFWYTVLSKPGLLVSEPKHLRTDPNRPGNS